MLISVAPLSMLIAHLSSTWAASEIRTRRPVSPLSRQSGITFATPAKVQRQPVPKAFLSDADCSLPSELDCKWSFSQLKCSPSCRNVDCGLISCNCQLIPSLERPPWLNLNVSHDAWCASLKRTECSGFN